MHYYKRNIGDYAKRAGRLSLLQHGVYTQLLDACYEREAFPTEQEAIDWVWASSTEEIEAVRFVLRRLFKEEEGRFVHDEVLNNLATYHAHGEANRVIALAREAKKRAAKQHEKARTVHEPCEVEHEPCTNRAKKAPNHKPINQEPRTNNQNTPPLPPDGGVAGLQNKKPEKPKSEESEAGFEKFWQVWPKSDRKQAKGLCLKAWKKAGAERHAADILAHIEACKRSENWSKEGGQFIPAPLVYLNQKRWEGAELAESVAAGESKFGSGFEGVM
jgi:uncharacterized protein YdaU (DUF1376 family)